MSFVAPCRFPYKASSLEALYQHERHKREALFLLTAAPSPLFKTGSAPAIVTALSCFIYYAQGSEEDVWLGSAKNMLTSVLMALVCLRDNAGLELNFDVLRSHLAFDALRTLLHHTALSPVAHTALTQYLSSLPSSSAPEMHGYLRMQCRHFFPSTEK